MFKKFRIDHEGYHRVAILFGSIFIFLTPWLAWLGERGFYSLSLDLIIFSHIGAVYEFFAYGDKLLIIHLFWYPIFYVIGYFSIKLFYWIRQGFNK